MDTQMKQILSTYGPIICVLAVILTWSLCVFTKTAIPSEGWYAEYAKMIFSGKLPYVDFEFTFAPLYLGIITGFSAIFGTNLMGYRILGIIVFVIISILFFKLFELLSERKIAAIATIVTMFATQDICYIAYDYSQFYTLFNISAILVALYYFSNKVNNIHCNEKYYLMLIGVLAGLAFLTRQSSGLIVIVFLIGSLLITKYIKQIDFDRRNIVYFIGGLAIPILITTLWILSINGMEEFISQVFLSGVKGSFTQMLSSWFVNLFNNWQNVVLLLLCIILYFTMLNSSSKLNSVVIMASVGLVFVLIHTTEVNNALFIFAMIVMCLLTIYLLFCSADGKINRENSGSIDNIYTLGLTVVPIILLFIYVNPFCKASFGFIEYCNMFVFWFICVIGIKLLIDAINSMRNNESVNELIFLFAFLFYLAVAFGCGTSGGLSVNQTGFGFALLGVYIVHHFELYKIDFDIKKVKVCAVVISLCFVGTAVMIKANNPYNWWGLSESPYDQCTEYSEVGYFDGISMSHQERLLYDTFKNDIDKYVGENDEIYCYSQITIFYLLADKVPTVKAPTPWFDVCRDSTAISDLQYLKAHNPKLIVFADHGYGVLEAHEKSFRDGGCSGQRLIYEWLLDCKNGDYKNGYYDNIQKIVVSGYVYYIMIHTEEQTVRDVELA